MTRPFDKHPDEARRHLIAAAGALALGAIPAAPLLAQAAAPAEESKAAAGKPPRAYDRYGRLRSQVFDVVVIGAGGAGLAAAVAAREAGAASVVVLEKAAVAGGHAMVSSGSGNAYDPEGQARMGSSDSLEAYWRDTYEGGGRAADPALVRTLVEGSESMLKWLEGMGVRFDPVLFEAYNALYPRSHRTLFSRSGYVYVRALMRRARSLGVSVAYRERATRFEMRDGAVAGVWTENADGLTTLWRARAVVLATGGFSSSMTLRQNWAPKLGSRFGTTYSVGFPDEDPATGDGIRMAAAEGAALRDMDAVMAIPFWGGRVLDYSGAEVFLSVLGKRFTAETRSWESVLNGLLETGFPDFWVVTDSASRKGATFATKVQQGTVRSAESLDALAEAMGIAPAQLKAEMDRYNEAARTGVDPDFGRTRFTQTIEKPPFYFGRERFDVHYTCGGVAITTAAAVKRENGETIPGLFAAGEVTGGVHGRFRLGGNGLTDAFVFGRIAGASAAAHAKTMEAAAE